LAARVIPGRQSDFLLELPPMRMPALRNILVKTLARMEWYLWEVVPIFVLGTAMLFVLDISGALVWLQTALAPLVVNWLGLPAEATNALLVGFLRRDYGAAGLFDLSRRGLLDPVQVLVSMVVITLFVPCVANVLMIVKEHGARTAFWVVATVFPIAILVGGLLNWVIRWGA
jgi:ferrous iron transport protein B